MGKGGQCVVWRGLAGLRRGFAWRRRGFFEGWLGAGLMGPRFLKGCHFGAHPCAAALPLSRSPCKWGLVSYPLFGHPQREGVGGRLPGFRRCASRMRHAARAPVVRRVARKTVGQGGRSQVSFPSSLWGGDGKKAPLSWRRGLGRRKRRLSSSGPRLLAQGTPNTPPAVEGVTSKRCLSSTRAACGWVAQKRLLHLARLVVLQVRHTCGGFMGSRGKGSLSCSRERAAFSFCGAASSASELPAVERAIDKEQGEEDVDHGEALPVFAPVIAVDFSLRSRSSVWDRCLPEVLNAYLQRR